MSAIKFRKKPVVVEAMQFTEESKDRVFHWITCTTYAGREDGKPCIVIQTLEGDMTVSLGDWVIRGVKGEFYPCKPDIFAATYERADDTREMSVVTRHTCNPRGYMGSRPKEERQKECPVCQRILAIREQERRPSLVEQLLGPLCPECGNPRMNCDCHADTFAPDYKRGLSKESQ